MNNKFKGSYFKKIFFKIFFSPKNEVHSQEATDTNNEKSELQLSSDNPNYSHKDPILYYTELFN